MRVPKRFFISVAVGVIATVAIFFVLMWLQLGLPTESSQWCYDLVVRKKQIADGIAGKKLVLVGGSSVLFSIRACDIQAATGIPTVNYGLHAALGSPYLLELTKQALKPGDTALLALEFEGYGDLPDIDTVFVDYLMSRDPDKFRSASWWTQVKWALSTPIGDLPKRFKYWHKRNARQKDTDFPYNASLLNEYGDQTGHIAAKRPRTTPRMFLPSQILMHGFPNDSEGARNIREFCAWAKANHIRVLATYPCILNVKEYDTSKTVKTLRQIENFYTSMGVPVIGDHESALAPEDCFFDTHYHMTEEAARERTKKLITVLAPCLKQEAN